MLWSTILVSPRRAASSALPTRTQPQPDEIDPDLVLSFPSPPPSTLRRNTKATKRRRPRSAPEIRERESSLYGPACQLGPSSFSSSTATPAVYSSSLPSATQSTSYFDQPFSSYTTLPFATSCIDLNYSAHQRRRGAFYTLETHSAVWDEIFDSAHSSARRVASSSSHHLGGPSSRRVKSQSVWDLRMSRDLGDMLERAGEEGWSTHPSPSTSTTPTMPPAIPPRSSLRSAPSALPLGEQHVLSVLPPLTTPPINDTPSLSSGHSSDDDEPSPPPVRTPLMPELQHHGLTFGRKKRPSLSTGADPARIRDGVEPQRSSSGVYTPPTFPGAQGPRPSHFPTHVYTPPSFQLHPTRPAPQPSAYNPFTPAPRSTSLPSAFLPEAGSSKFAAAAAVKSRLRRLSHQLPAMTLRQAPSTASPSTPQSARESYFSADSVHSRQSSVGPVTPTSQRTMMAEAGLGVGLMERADGRTAEPMVVVIGSPKEAVKRGKRKPVPKVVQEEEGEEQEDELAEGVERVRIDEGGVQVHAL